MTDRLPHRAPYDVHDPPNVTRGDRQTADLAWTAEVVVVGSGAGGAPAAAGLAARGVDVVLIEAGSYHSSRDFNQREMDMLPLLFAEAGCRGTADLAIPILTGRCVGGGTTHNTGYIYRAPHGIRERWRREAGLDLDDAALGRLYRDVERAIGVTTVPASELNRLNRIVLDGAEALGWRAHTVAHNRLRCSGCGYCVLGCAYDVKQGALVTFVPRFLLAGGRLLTDAPADRLARRGDGWRVEGTLACGRPYTVDAARVVVSAGAIDGPALLQRSGLGGRAVGRHLHLHPGAAVGAVFPDEVIAWRGVPQATMVEEFAHYFDAGSDGRGGYLLMPANATPALTAPLVPGLGERHRRAMELLPRLATACVLLHDETDGRVRNRRRQSGRPRIDYWPDRRDRAALREALGRLARLLFAAGAEEVQLPFEGLPTAPDQATVERQLARASLARHRLLLQSVHPQSTCRMGTDLRTSVVRPDLRLHDAEGVYVADTSVYPSSIGVPPQLTAMMLGTYCAEILAG